MIVDKHGLDSDHVLGTPEVSVKNAERNATKNSKPEIVNWLEQLKSYRRFSGVGVGAVLLKAIVAIT